MKPFNSDVHLEEEMKKIINAFGVELVIETGTYKGASTNWFAKNVDKVCTCELNAKYFNEALSYLTAEGHDNFSIFKGNSPEGLEMFLEENIGKNILVFLDAHWYNYCPLMDELEVIENSDQKPILVIHDFKVEGEHELPEKHYDSYNDQDYEWSWIKDAVEDIYGEDGYEKYYNSKATGSQRGCLFIIPKNK